MTQLAAVENALARLKQTYDRQAVMALVGMAVVCGFLVFDSSDHGRTVAELLDILPWFVGVSAVVLALNRWALRSQSRAVRRHFGQAGDA